MTRLQQKKIMHQRLEMQKLRQGLRFSNQTRSTIANHLLKLTKTKKKRR